MYKPNTWIKAGLLSLGLVASSLGFQGNDEHVKAAVNRTHSKIKYTNNQNESNLNKGSNVSYANSRNVHVSGNYNSNSVSNGKLQKSKHSKKITKSYANSNTQTNSNTQKSSANLNTTSSTVNKKVRHKKANEASKKRNQAAISNQNATVSTKLNSNKNKKKSSKYHKNSVHTDSKQALQLRSANLALSSSASKSTGSSGSSNVTANPTTLFSMSDLIKKGEKYLGSPYVYGATGQNNSFDCSGFTKYIYEQFNLNLPRTAQQQYDNFSHVSASKARKGDLVFFGSNANNISHVGIYIGNGKMLDAQNQGVITENVNAPWWNLIGYARVS